MVFTLDLIEVGSILQSGEFLTLERCKYSENDQLAGTTFTHTGPGLNTKRAQTENTNLN